MPAAAVVGGLGLVGSLVGADSQRHAANQAADAQRAAAQNAAQQQQQAFDTVQQNLAPYRELGQQGISGVQGLLGLNGAGAQQQAINAIQSGPQYQSLLSEGENAMRQNASATGGLRGGNFQAALQRFRPQLLGQLIDQQYSRLGGLLNTGQNAAAGVGQAALQTGQNLGSLSNDMGAYQAGGILGGARANAGLFRDIGGMIGQNRNAIGNWAGNLFGGGASSTPSYGYLTNEGAP